MMRMNGTPKRAGYRFIRVPVDVLRTGREGKTAMMDGPAQNWESVSHGRPWLPWGDEGKGKLVDILSAEADVCARCAGGNNAGHTIVVPGDGPGKPKTTYAFHLLPSGLVNPNCVGMIGSGVVVHIPSFFEELDALQAQGLDCSNRLFISDRAHLVFDFHQIVDGLKEVELGGSSIGTTRRGIGPAYSGKASRSGMRVHHLFDHDTFAEKFRKLVEGRFKREIVRYKALAARLKPFVIDSVHWKRVLVEGANALMLDLDFGTYPFVTSSSTTIGGVCTGLGIPPRMVGRRSDVGVHLQEVGREYGTTTGRRRRCGWLDLVVMKHSCLINGYDCLNLTKLDVLDTLSEIKVAVKYLVDGKELPGFPADLAVLARVEVEYVMLPGWNTSISIMESYDALPIACKSYVLFIENFLGVPVEWIGVGPGRESMLRKAIK
ncbi:Adenylosuccinate synthetase [Infundibulicybe gibba]|nr:Adenylosuccinate synthetase [Infundibulicybe gibba]